MYPRKRISPKILWIGAVTGLVILIILLGMLDFPGWLLRGISSLVPQAKQSAYTSEEVQALRDRVGELEGENAYLNEMVSDLQSQSGLNTIDAALIYGTVDARVIYRDHARLFDTAIINRGIADGVEVGMPVMDYRGLVGRVVSTRAAISRIVLVSSPDCAFGVLDQRSREIGIVRGSENVQWSIGFDSGSNETEIPPDVLQLEYLSPSADISVHDTLITSGLSGVTPLGIRVGEVIEIISHTEQGWYDIRVSPFADLNHLENVAVILYSGETQTQLEELLKENGAEMGPPAPG
jgi:rod shape-determining protein MreC